jgi:hypothetical protein
MQHLQIAIEQADGQGLSVSFNDGESILAGHEQRARSRFDWIRGRPSTASHDEVDAAVGREVLEVVLVSADVKTGTAAQDRQQTLLED